MIQINELRVTHDGKHLIIDVLIEPLTYYENVYLDSIIIDTQKTYTPLGPSSKPLFTIDCKSVKHYRDFIDIDSISDNMFFVYVISNGEASDDTPCGLDESPILGVTYSKYPIYQLSIKMLSSMNGCEPNGDLMDFIFRHKAFDLSLKTGNYNKAIEYWNLFFDEKEKIVKPNCGCHGKFR